MRKNLLLLILVTGAAAHAQTPAPVRATIDTLGTVRREHPYLLFTTEEKNAMMARIRADPREAEAYEALALEGRRLLLSPVEADDVPERVIHTRWAGADDYRRAVTRHLNAAYTLAFLYQTTGDAKYVDRAFAHADVVCAQESWVQSAHTFEVIYPRVWPQGASDDQVVFTYDITASGTSQRMAFIYDWLYAGLSKSQRDRLRGALLEKAITRVRGSYEYFWWNTASKCNWSGICHSGLGLAALALLNEDPQLTDVVAHSYEGVSALLDHIGEDGGWQEGRGYWAYGVGESLRFIDALKRVSGGRLDLYQHRALRQHPLDFALFGLTGGFCDGGGTPVGESFVVNQLVRQSGDGTAAWYAKNFVRPHHEILDFIWPAATVTPQAPADGSRFFPSVDWAVLRRDFSANSLTVATKAGMNDDPHHGHLDCGTFNLTWHNLPFIGEVPRTPYDENYFGALRWEYLEARTSGHNCVLVNGEEQICAKLKDQPWREGIGGHINAFVSTDQWAGVAMDPTHAYPGRELKGWNRWIVLDKDLNVAVVVDRVRSAPGAAIEVRFHPGVEATLAGDHVTLKPVTRASADAPAANRRNPSVANREALMPRAAATQLPAASGRRVTDLQMLPLASAPFTLIEGSQPEVPITKEPQLSWVPYFSTTVRAVTDDTVIVSVFCPADLRDGEGALTCRLYAAQGSPRVSYTVHGKTTAYTLNADKLVRE